MATVDLIRFGGRVNYVDRVFVSSSFVEESLQAIGGGRSARRSPVAAAERPSVIYASARRSKAAGLIWPSVECRRRWL